MASEADKPRPAVPQLFELDVSQQPVKPPPQAPKSPVAARQARATALALSHQVSSASLTPPKQLQRGTSMSSSPALEPLPSMISSASILPRPSPEAGRASAQTTGKAAVAAARGAAASPAALPVYNRRASGPASSAAASAVRQMANSQGLPPLQRSPAASPVPTGAGALPALSGTKARGGGADSSAAASPAASGMSRSSSVPALARGSPAGAAGGRRSSMKGSGKAAPLPPPPEPEVALAKAGLGLFNFGSMVNVVDAVMGKTPESRRSGPGALSAPVAATLRTQVPDLVIGNRQTPGVARGGGLFVASGPSIYVVDEDGHEMSPISCAAVGLSEKTFVAACDPISRLVFCADCVGEESVLVAFKPQPLGEATVRWCTRPGEVYNCYGIAVLPKQVGALVGCPCLDKQRPPPHLVLRSSSSRRPTTATRSRPTARQTAASAGRATSASRRTRPQTQRRGRSTCRASRRARAGASRAHSGARACSWRPATSRPSA